MYIVHVNVHVKPENIKEFIEATLDNAGNSVKEPGIARFDVIQSKEDETRFVLVEVYRTDKDPTKHKETPHYARWRQAVEGWMADPRTSMKYNNIFPDDAGW